MEGTRQYRKRQNKLVYLPFKYWVFSTTSNLLASLRMTKCVKKIGATCNMQSEPKTCDITQQLVAVGSNESALCFFGAFGSITDKLQLIAQVL